MSTSLRTLGPLSLSLLFLYGGCEPPAPVETEEKTEAVDEPPATIDTKH